MRVSPLTWAFGCVLPLAWFSSCKSFESAVETGLPTEQIAEQLEPLPAAPDYTRESCWAALPWRQDPADEWPKTPAIVAGLGQADVFYIHPTMYEAGAAWNAPVDSAELNAAVGEWPLKHQASIFNGAGRVFAPRYRQAHLRVFSVKDSLSAAALQVAYQDVRSAFQHFLTEWDEGRPLILAAHSQGSWHARWLLQEFFDGQPLSDRLVVAYIPGMDIYASDFAALPPCQTRDDFHCFCSWMSYGRGYLPDWLAEVDEPPAAIHPIEWTTNPGVVNERKRHFGSVMESFKTTKNGSITAELQPEGVLWIDRPHVFLVGRWLHRENWHVGDFNLFWHNVRYNTLERMSAYLSAN